MTEVLATKAEAREVFGAIRCRGKSLGFVPTMGAVHDGHLSLVRAARERCDVVAASVFVNPTQFGVGEDFETYPRDLEADLTALGAEGCAWVFAPSTEEMYGPGGGESGDVSVDPGPLALRWEGVSRPGHFAGVATVVAKLFGIVRPDCAFFGEKDYQQLKVVERLVADLDMGVEVAACPTVREPDGLAMSSRNACLTAAERSAATVLYRALCAAADAVVGGETDAARVDAVMDAAFAREPSAVLDYAAVVDPETLEPVGRIDGEVRALVAARVGQTRLIDNMTLHADMRPCGEDAE